MKATELREAIAQGKKLIWNDPDPIEGNDYRIDKVTLLYTEDWEEEEDLTASISYGGGSEATVFINEIGYADPLDRIRITL